MRPGAVYSEQTQCQDCYKCVRECPVKAIRVNGGHAVVLSERCIACGACVGACASGAKRVREDLDLVQALFRSGRPVVASLAPSFRSEFPGLAPEKLIAALKRLGFAAVSETALGAQEVSARLARDLDASRGRLWLSTACPVAVDLVTKYLPGRASDLTPVDSPLQAHARLIRQELSPEALVVFIGPCIGKKLEAARTPELIQAALTFEDLRRWLGAEGLAPEALDPGPGDAFAPREAREGSLYPVEGGMIQATRVHMATEHTRFVTLSGVEPIRAALADLPEAGEGNLFLELLACPGGCVCGPKATKTSSVRARMQVLDGARMEPGAYPRPAALPIDRAFGPEPLGAVLRDEAGLREALRRIGKQGPEDELNCGACGYDTCRELAAAMLAERAEERMCVSHLRRQAEKKANALLRTLPLGVVIVDQELRIIESNEEFARITGEDALAAFEAEPGLAGAYLEKFVSFVDRFRDVLAHGEDIIREKLVCGSRTFSATIFTVEPHRVVGGLLLEITDAEARQRQIIEKAELVIQNMLGNVQEIACSLGRNAARSEGILNSIIAEFAGPEREDVHVPRR